MSINTNNLLFLVTKADGSQVILTFEELREYKIPDGATVTVVTADGGTASPPDLKLKIVGSDLVLIADEEVVIEGVLSEAPTVFVGDAAELTSAEWKSLNDYMTGEVGGVDAATAGMSSSSLLGLMGFVGFIGVAGSSGSSGSANNGGVQETTGVVVTQFVDDVDPANPVTTLTITFDEDVNGFDISDISVANGTLSNFAGSNAVYTVEIRPTDLAQPVTYSINQGAGVTNADSSVVTAAANGTLDLTAPGVSSITSSSSDNTITITFDEPIDAETPVSGFAFKVGGVTVNSVDVSASISGSAIQFTIDSGISAGDLIEITYNPAPGDLEDAVGNDAESLNITSGIVADGYIKGASVFLVNADGDRWDTGATTDANGNYFLDSDAVAAKVTAWNGTDYSIVIEGGYNVDTGVSNTQTLSAPSGSTVVNPLTTLIDELVKSSGVDVATAEGQVASALGLDDELASLGVSLLELDPISVANAGNPDSGDALAIQKAAALVATVIAYAEAESGDAATSDAVVGAIVQKISDSSLDLSPANQTVLVQELTGQSDVTDLMTALGSIESAASIADISGAQSALLDTIAPAAGQVSLDPSADTGNSSSDGLTNLDTVSVRVTLNTSATDGTAVALGDEVSLFRDGVFEDSVFVTDTDLNRGYVSFAGVSLADNSDMFTASIEDRAGLTSELSAGVSFELDQTAPEASLVTPISGGYINANEVKSGLVFSGTLTGVEVGQPLTLKLTDSEGQSISKTVTVSGETYSVSVSSYDQLKLAEGEINVSVSVEDAAGNANDVTELGSYVYDPKAPDAPGNLKLTNDTGSANDDNISNSLAIEPISGVEPDGGIAEYRVDGGAWSQAYTAPTSQGEHEVEVRQIDAAGNESAITKLTVTLDSVKPDFTSLASATIKEEVGADSVIYTATSSDATTVTYAFGNGSLTQDTGNGILTMNAVTGAVSLSIDPDLSIKSSYTFDVLATDLAGNEQSQSVTVTVDNINEAPFVKDAYASAEELPAFTAVKDQAAQSGSNLAQYFDDADLTETETESLTFTLTPGNLATLEELGLSFDTSDGSIYGTTDFTGLSDARLAELQSGETFTVTVTDSSSESVSSDFTFKAVSAPVILSFTIADGEGDPGAGKSGDSYTIVAALSEPVVFTEPSVGNEPTFVLTFADGSTSIATYQLDSYNNTDANLTFTADAPTSGNASSASIQSFDLGDADVVGRLSNQSMIISANNGVTADYRLDNLISEPVITLDDTGTSSTDGVTNDDVVTAAIDGDATWEVTVNDITSNGVGTTFTLQEGFYAAGSITVTQTDTAGNTESYTTSSQITVDTTAPDAPGNLKLTNDTGSANDDNISNSLAIEPISGVEPDGGIAEYRVDGGAWSRIYTAPTSQGEHVVETRQIDAAGNESAITKLTVTLDSVKPDFTSLASATIKEEVGADSVIYTATSSDATTVTYAFGNGSLTQDTGNGILTMNAVTGAVSLSIDPDLSVESSYTFDVWATDLAGNEQSQSVTVTVTNKNEAPFVKDAYASAEELPAFTAVKDQAAQSGNNLAQYFDDPDLTETDNESLTFTLSSGNLATLEELGLSFNTADGSISGTTDFAGLSDARLAVLQSGELFTVTVTDGSSASVSSDFTFKAVSAPVLSTALESVTNFDPRSDIVFSMSESVRWGADGTYKITINNTANSDAKAGFRGEATDNNQVITVTVASGTPSFSGGVVSIDNQTGLFVVNPDYDLDLSNNYTISIDAGMLVGASSGLASLAVTDVAFSTVTPGSLVSDSLLLGSIDDLSQAFDETSGALVDSYIWVDGNQGNTFDPTIVSVNAADNNLAIALGFDSQFQTQDAYLQVSGYTSDDLLYLDNLGNNSIQSFDDTEFNTAMAKVDGETAKYFDTQSEGTKASQALVVLEGVAYKFDASLYETELPDLLYIG